MSGFEVSELEWDARQKRYISNGLVWSATRTKSFLVVSDQSLVRHSKRFPAGLKVVLVPHTRFRSEYTDERVIALLLSGDAWFAEEVKG
jgi:glycerol kinase